MTNFEPYAEDLILGQPLPAAPPITIDDGLAWQYQGICGDSLRLPLSRPLAQRVTGQPSLVNPGLALQIAIGQSTVATRRVIANLFYRDVRLKQQPPLGSTLSTVVTPVAAAPTRPSAAGPRAKVLLSIVTKDQDDRLLADFQRLALLPVHDESRLAIDGEIGTAAADVDLDDYIPDAPRGWDLRALSGPELPVFGNPVADPLAEPVTDALALVRLTQNLAAPHRDARRGQRGRRLVYGGHTIGLAQAALSRIDPGIATIVGWQSCDHVGPVFEGDLLETHASLVAAIPHEGGTLAAYDVQVTATHADESDSAVVLAWTPIVLTASRLTHPPRRTR